MIFISTNFKKYYQKLSKIRQINNDKILDIF